MDRFPTHILISNGGQMTNGIGQRVHRDRFAQPLRRFNGRERWALGLFPVPEDTDYDKMRAEGRDFTEFVQAGGAADALTVEIRKPGGEQWGCKWVRYVVGHGDVADGPIDVDIPMNNAVLEVRAAEVFDAEEVADLFCSYHQTGDIPTGYSLRPIEGYRADGSAVEIATGAAS